MNFIGLPPCQRIDWSTQHRSRLFCLENKFLIIFENDEDEKDVQFFLKIEKLGYILTNENKNLTQESELGKKYIF